MIFPSWTIKRVAIATPCAGAQVEGEGMEVAAEAGMVRELFWSLNFSGGGRPLFFDVINGACLKRDKDFVRFTLY